MNLGPLLYHYSDMPNEDSIEPTYEDIILIIKAIGFKILVIFFYKYRIVNCCQYIKTVYFF